MTNLQKRNYNNLQLDRGDPGSILVTNHICTCLCLGIYFCNRPSTVVTHDSSVREWMYLTVCPLCGPGHDSSVGEWMYLTVCPLHGPGHDSSVRKWMYLAVCPLLGLGSIPTAVGYFSLFFWLITCVAPPPAGSLRKMPVNPMMIMRCLYVKCGWSNTIGYISATGPVVIKIP